MRRVLVKIFLFIVALFASVLGLIVILNWSDVPLRPEVAKILSERQEFSPTQMRAYWLVMGLHAGDTREPEKTGEALWAKRADPEMWRSLGAIPENDDTVSAYVRLMELGEGVQPFEPTAEIPMTRVVPIPFYLHRGFLRRLEDWIERGGHVRAMDVLASSNRFLASFYTQGPLLDRTIAVAGVSQNARFLVEALAKHPKLKVSQDLIASFKPIDPTDLMFGAMRTETRYAHAMLASMKTADSLQVSALEDAPSMKNHALSFIPLSLLLKRNETMNVHYDLVQESASTDCVMIEPGKETDCLPAMAYLRPRYPWQWLRNPFGRTVLDLLTLDVVNRKARIKLRAQELLTLKDEISKRL